MEFSNDFVVPVPPTQAWDALMDMEQVARCMPGATLLSSDDDRFVGKVKVKVGPITVSYKGAAEFSEKDPEAGRAVLRATGREERGAGTAGMTVTAQLEPEGGDQTRVRVLTDLDLTGRPAQFGRGVMAEVGTAIIGKFATNLAGQLAGPAAAETPAEPAKEPPGGSAPDPGADQAEASEPVSEPEAARAEPEPDALNLGAVAWLPLVKRALPVAGAAVVTLALLRWLSRGDRSGRYSPAVIVVYGSPPPGIPAETW